MTKTDRPLIAIFALALCVTLWVPTVSMPAQAASFSIALIEMA